MDEERAALLEQLGSHLRHVRTLAGISQTALDLRQATVSQIERGRRVPTRDQVEVWLRHADRDAAAEIHDLLKRVHLQVRPWEALRAGREHLSDLAAAEIAQTVEVRSWQQSVLPGLLQTAEYARAVLAAHGIGPAGAAARIAHQQMLYEPGRSFSFLIAERLLACAPVGTAGRAAQLGHIAALASLDAVTLGIVPDAALVLVGVGFMLRTPAGGQVHVTMELPDGEHVIHDPDRVERYEATWGRLRDQAAVGDDAIDVVRAAATR